MSDAEVQEVRRKFFIAVGIGVLAIILVWFGFTTVLPRIMRAVRGEASYAGFPTSHWTEALASKNPSKTWRDAANTLLQGGEKAVPVLTQCLKAEEVQARHLAAKLLSQIRSKNAISALAVSQKDSDTKVRCWSAYALLMTAPEEGKASIPTVLEATGIEGEGIEEEVDKALPLVPADKRLAGLIEALNNPYIHVRFLAVKHLAAMGRKPRLPCRA
jgi:HEAT repeat protein